MEFSQTSRKGHSGSPAIRQELNDLLGRKLFASKTDGETSSNGQRISASQMANEYNRPFVPPKPQLTRPRHNLSTQLNETNRQLLKEMIEKNRSKRRLSTSGTNERRSSGSYVIKNPYLRSQSLQMDPIHRPMATTSRSRLVPAAPPTVDLARIQTSRGADDEIRPAAAINTPADIQAERSETSADSPSPSADVANLIDLTPETVTTEDATMRTTDESVEVPDANAGPSNGDSQIVTAARSNWPVETSIDAVCRESIAASSQSLDSFLQSPSASTTATAGPGPDANANATSQSTTSLNSNVSYDDSPGELRISNKVVWFTPRGVPETGTVKWIGKLKDRYYAGVEFEKPIGNSSGLYQGKKLFNCSLTHGRFVPISELILHIDFYAGSCSNEPSSYSCGIPSGGCDSETKAFAEPPIVCVICQDSLIISASVDDDDFFPNHMPSTTTGKNFKKNLSKSMDELSVKDTRTLDPGPSISAAVSTTTNNKEMVATRCGHLFHSDCLTQWFRLKKRLHQPCPYCQHLMHVQDTIRIYPVQGTL